MTAIALAMAWAVLVGTGSWRVARRWRRPRRTLRSEVTSNPQAAPPATAAKLPEPSTPRRTGWLGRRRQERRRRAALAAALPDCIDRLAVAVAAGLNVRLALGAVGRRAPPGPLTLALRQVEAEVQAGARLGEAIERLPAQLGEAVRPLTAALLDAERYGVPLGPTLGRLSDESRRTRQREAEEAARRIPVKLLFPLVTCILPAFGLLTVVPLIAGGLRALRL